jgi:hypothetical protein
MEIRFPAGHFGLKQAGQRIDDPKSWQLMTLQRADHRTAIQ